MTAPKNPILVYDSFTDEEYEVSEAEFRVIEERQINGRRGNWDMVFTQKAVFNYEHGVRTIFAVGTYK